MIGFVGRIEPRKGPLDLVRAAPAIRAGRPDASIVIIGDDPYGTDRAYTSTVKAAPGDRALPVDRRMRPGLMRHLDVLVLPGLPGAVRNRARGGDGRRHAGRRHPRRTACRRWCRTASPVGWSSPGARASSRRRCSTCSRGAMRWARPRAPPPEGSTSRTTSTGIEGADRAMKVAFDRARAGRAGHRPLRAVPARGAARADRGEIVETHDPGRVRRLPLAVDRRSAAALAGTDGGDPPRPGAAQTPRRVPALGASVQAALPRGPARHTGDRADRRRSPTTRSVRSSIPADRMVVIPEAPASVFWPRPAEEVASGTRALRASRRYLLWVGGLRTPDPRKRVAALARARRTLPLVLVGADRSLGRELPDVTLTGAVNDEELAAIYTGAHALVFPSDDEGFGLPPVEALACGTPVAACDVPALREVLDGRVALPGRRPRRAGPHRRGADAAGPGPHGGAGPMRPPPPGRCTSRRCRRRAWRGPAAPDGRPRLRPRLRRAEPERRRSTRRRGLNLAAAPPCPAAAAATRPDSRRAGGARAGARGRTRAAHSRRSADRRAAARPLSRS